MGKGRRYGGGYGMPNQKALMKQMQQLQEEMQTAQTEIENTEVEGSAGGGMVRVKLNGKKEVQSLTIDPAIVDPEDVEMLEDVVAAAVNDAMKKVDAMQEQRMGRLTGGMNIPGLS